MHKAETENSAVAEHVSGICSIVQTGIMSSGHSQHSNLRKIRETIHIRQCGDRVINGDIGMEVSYVWDSQFSSDVGVSICYIVFEFFLYSV